MKITISLILFLFLFQASISQETKIIYLSGKDSESTIDWDFKVSKGIQAKI